MRSATKGTTLSLIIGLFFLQASYSNSQQPTKQSLTNSIGINLVLIPKGKFLMGSPETEEKVSVRPTPWSIFIVSVS